MIEIEGGTYIASEHVAVIKEVDKDRCVVFIVGQSATDGGFLVDRPALELATDVLEDKREWEEWKASLLTSEDGEEPDEEEEENPEETEEPEEEPENEETEEGD